MKFQKGNKMAAGHSRKAQKLMTDALRYIGQQKLGPRGHIAIPKHGTVIQCAAAALWREALKGDANAWEKIANRLEGRVPQSIMGDLWDAPEEVQDEMTMRELARCVGYLLLSQQPEGEPITIEN